MKDQASKLRKLARKSITVGVTSGKGGVGKTNITINLAVLLAKRGENVLILDGDLSLANVDLLFGVSPQYNIKDAILGDKSLDDIIVDGSHGVKIIPAASGVEELADLPDEKREVFIDAFKKFEEQFDFIFIDTAAGIAKNVTHFLLASDEAIIITTPELTALADAYAVIKILAMNKSLTNVKVLVNLVKTKNQAIETIGRIKVVASQFLGIEVEDFGFIYEDNSVQQAVLQQTPLVVSFPYSRAAICLKTIADNLMELKGETEHKESLFERIAKVPTPPKDSVKQEFVTEKAVRPEPPTLEPLNSQTLELPNSQPPNVIRKRDFVNRIALLSGFNQKKSKLILDKLLSAITSALVNNEPVKLQRFGRFGVRMRSRRKYYHPVLKEFIDSEARTLPYFKSSKCLIRKIQNAE